MVDNLIISIELIKSACAGGQIEAMDELAGILINNYSWEERRRKHGEINLVARDKYLSPSLTRHLAYRMLRACQSKALPPPSSLIELFKLVLGQDRPPAKSERKYMKRLEAVSYLEAHPGAGSREIAREVGVSPSTVVRWRRSGKL